MRQINIEDLLGVRYKTGGRTLDGLDCYGLAIIVCRRFGYILPDIDGANRQEFLKYMGECLNLVKAQRVSAPSKEADIILIKDSNGVLGHMGIYLGNGLFIHCDYLGTRVEKVSKYKDRIGGVYSWL